MKTSEILIAAKALIDTPEKWTRGSFARDSENYHVDFYSKDAVCYCSLGALYKSQQGIHSLEAALAKRHLWYAAGESIAEYNDTHTHPEVMAVWDKAIELAKKDEETNV